MKVEPILEYPERLDDFARIHFSGFSSDELKVGLEVELMDEKMKVPAEVLAEVSASQLMKTVTAEGTPEVRGLLDVYHAYGPSARFRSFAHRRATLTCRYGYISTVERSDGLPFKRPVKGSLKGAFKGVGRGGLKEGEEEGGGRHEGGA